MQTHAVWEGSSSQVTIEAAGIQSSFFFEGKDSACDKGGCICTAQNKLERKRKKVKILMLDSDSCISSV